MKCIVLIVVAFLGFAAGQHRRAVDSRNAAILQEARFLSGDGSFGSAYVSEDGAEFKEESGLDGERKGQYSYFDPNGQKITVQYTAGKNGFQVSGDHLPKAPQPIAPVAPQQQRSHYQPSYHQPQQSYQHQPASFHHTGAPIQSIPDTPEVAAAKAEHFRAVEEARRTQQSLQQQNPSQYSAPQNNHYEDDGQYREDNGQYNPAYNNPSYQAPAAPRQHQQPSFNSFNGFPAQNQFNNFNNFQPATTTPAPHRFFPPGKLNLNRTPDGYQYSFSSN
jgi:hypothetical protein